MVKTNATFVRWRQSESRRCRIFPPLDPDHPAYDAMCLLCDNELGIDLADKGVQLVALGPAEDSREKFAEGRWSTCHALICHEYCVSRCSDADLDELAGAVQFEEFDQEETV